MKICITSEGASRESLTDPRFGRCAYFAVADTGSGEMEFFENPNKAGMGGAGIRSGQFMAEKNVKAVLTGNLGPNAFDILKAAGIDIYTGITGNVQAAYQRFISGDMKKDERPNVDAHFGTGS